MTERVTVKPLVFDWVENFETNALFEMNCTTEGIECRVTQAAGGFHDWAYVVDGSGVCGLNSKEQAQSQAELSANMRKVALTAHARKVVEQFPEVLSALDLSPSCPHCGGECGGSNGWCADISAAPRDGRWLLADCEVGVPRVVQWCKRDQHWWMEDDFSAAEPVCWCPTPPAREGGE